MRLSRPPGLTLLEVVVHSRRLRAQLALLAGVCRCDPQPIPWDTLSPKDAEGKKNHMALLVFSLA